MTKSRDSPIAGASRRSSRAHSAWNVEIHIREQSVPQQRRHARAHLLGGLVGERDGEHARRAGARPVRDEVRDAVRDDARLARAGAGEDQHGAVGLQHGLALFGIQAGREIHSDRTADAAAAAAGEVRSADGREQPSRQLPAIRP